MFLVLKLLVNAFCSLCFICTISLSPSSLCFFFEWSFASQALASVCVCVCVRMLGWLRYEVENFVNEDLLDKGYEVLRVCVCGCVCVCVHVRAWCASLACLFFSFSLLLGFFLTQPAVCTRLGGGCSCQAVCKF